MQNGICESYNGRMRDELLNETLFLGLDHARTAIAAWVADYNGRRPHSSLGYLTPEAFAANFTATTIRAATPTRGLATAIQREPSSHRPGVADTPGICTGGGPKSCRMRLGS